MSTVVVASFATLFVGYFAYSAYREPIAKDQALQFCATVKVGSPADGLLERALALGADKRHTKWFKSTDDTSSLGVTFIGAPPFSRHVCWIEANQTVVKVHYGHLD